MRFLIPICLFVFLGPVQSLIFSKLLQSIPNYSKLLSLSSSSSSSSSSSNEKDQLKVGVVIIDHGSKRKDANEALERLTQSYKSMTGEVIVEAAHMELSEPSIKTAFIKCIEQGATRIVYHPYFLSYGKHVMTDIPALIQEVTNEYPHIPYTITQPIGMEKEILNLIQNSIERAKTQL